jgi:hypothetical protein
MTAFRIAREMDFSLDLHSAVQGGQGLSVVGQHHTQPYPTPRSFWQFFITVREELPGTTNALAAKVAQAHSQASTGNIVERAPVDAVDVRAGRFASIAHRLAHPWDGV